MNSKNAEVPTTFEEAMVALTKILSPEEQIELTKGTREDLYRYHHGLGRWMRNNWGLWSGGPLAAQMTSLGFTHADDMSGSLIKEFWLRMNNLPSELERDIKEYKEFWEKSKRERESIT
jgi:hypothetical protein